MDSEKKKYRRRSSILKVQKEAEDVNAIPARRVSFSSNHFIKQFAEDDQCNTIWDTTIVEKNNPSPDAAPPGRHLDFFEGGIPESFIADKENINILARPKPDRTEASSMDLTCQDDLDKSMFSLTDMSMTCQIPMDERTRDMSFTCRIPFVGLAPSTGRIEHPAGSPVEDMSFTCQIPVVKSTTSMGAFEHRAESPVEDMSLTCQIPVVHPAPSTGQIELAIKSSVKDMSFTCQIPVVNPAPSTGIFKLPDGSPTEDMSFTCQIPVVHPATSMEKFEIPAGSPMEDMSFTCQIPVVNPAPSTEMFEFSNKSSVKDMPFMPVVNAAPATGIFKLPDGSPMEDVSFTCQIPVVNPAPPTGEFKLSTKSSVKDMPFIPVVNPAPSTGQIDHSTGLPMDMSLTCPISVVNTAPSTEKFKFSTKSSVQDMPFTCPIPVVNPEPSTGKFVLSTKSSVKNMPFIPVVNPAPSMGQIDHPNRSSVEDMPFTWPISVVNSAPSVGKFVPPTKSSVEDMLLTCQIPVVNPASSVKKVEHSTGLPMDMSLTCQTPLVNPVPSAGKYVLLTKSSVRDVSLTCQTPVVNPAPPTGQIELPTKSSVEDMPLTCRIPLSSVEIGGVIPAGSLIADESVGSKDIPCGISRGRAETSQFSAKSVTGLVKQAPTVERSTRGRIESIVEDRLDERVNLSSLAKEILDAVSPDDTTDTSLGIDSTRHLLDARFSDFCLDNIKEPELVDDATIRDNSETSPECHGGGTTLIDFNEFEPRKFVPRSTERNDRIRELIERHRRTVEQCDSMFQRIEAEIPRIPPSFYERYEREYEKKIAEMSQPSEEIEPPAPPYIDTIKNYSKNKFTWELSSSNDTSIVVKTLFNVRVRIDFDHSGTVNLVKVDDKAIKNLSARLVRNYFLKKIHPDVVSAALGTTYSVLSLLDYYELMTEKLKPEMVAICETLAINNLLKVDERSRATFSIVPPDLSCEMIFSIDCADIDDVSIDSISIETKFGEINIVPLINLASECDKGIAFLGCYIEKLKSYLKVTNPLKW